MVDTSDQKAHLLTMTNNSKMEYNEYDDRKNNQNDNNAKNFIQKTKMTMEIQRWIHIQNKDPNKPQDHSDKIDNDMMMVKRKEDRPFWKNMRNKIPFHLVQIIHLLQSESSMYVNRITVDCFCRCILVDTYTYWLGNTSTCEYPNEMDASEFDGISWIDIVKEYCLTMISNPSHGKYAFFSFLESYIIHGHFSSLSLLLHPKMFRC